MYRHSCQHRRHNKNLLMAHIILVTKYRKRILFRDIRDDVKQSLFEICCRHHWYIVRMETDKDHIHLLLQYPPMDSITRIVTTIKSYSTYHMWRKHHKQLSGHYWKEHTLWSDGYFAASIGEVSAETIRRYIESQG